MYLVALFSTALLTVTCAKFAANKLKQKHGRKRRDPNASYSDLQFAIMALLALITICSLVAVSTTVMHDAGLMHSPDLSYQEDGSDQDYLSFGHFVTALITSPLVFWYSLSVEKVVGKALYNWQT